MGDRLEKYQGCIALCLLIRKDHFREDPLGKNPGTESSLDFVNHPRGRRPGCSQARFAVLVGLEKQFREVPPGTIQGPSLVLIW